MELETISMERPKAREAFLSYRRAVRERHDAEDEQIMRGYRALARGQQLIVLSEIMRAGGIEEKWFRRSYNNSRYKVGVPRLAVARANREFTYTDGISQNGYLAMVSKEDVAPNNRFDRVILPSGTFDSDEERRVMWGSSPLRAMVPKIPPDLRPAHGLHNYHILWEAEWKQHPAPPGDPALLKHIGGDLYAVLATWDLTPLEQAVLAGRNIS